jgi:flagellar hook-length control protein FliK
MPCSAKVAAKKAGPEAEEAGKSATFSGFLGDQVLQQSPPIEPGAFVTATPDQPQENAEVSGQNPLLLAPLEASRVGLVQDGGESFDGFPVSVKLDDADTDVQTPQPAAQLAVQHVPGQSVAQDIPDAAIPGTGRAADSPSGHASGKPEKPEHPSNHSEDRRSIHREWPTSPSPLATQSISASAMTPPGTASVTEEKLSTAPIPAIDTARAEPDTADPKPGLVAGARPANTRGTIAIDTQPGTVEAPAFASTPTNAKQPGASAIAEDAKRELNNTPSVSTAPAETLRPQSESFVASGSTRSQAAPTFLIASGMESSSVDAGMAAAASRVAEDIRGATGPGTAAVESQSRKFSARVPMPSEAPSAKQFEGRSVSASENTVAGLADSSGLPVTAGTRDGRDDRPQAEIGHGNEKSLFTQMDIPVPGVRGTRESSAGQGATSLLHVGGREILVGVHDPSYGWVEVKAQSVSGQVSASLFAASTAASHALEAQLPAMANYLAQRDVDVANLGVMTHTSGGDGSLAGQGGHSGGGASARSQSEHTQAAAPLEMGVSEDPLESMFSIRQATAIRVVA